MTEIELSNRCDCDMPFSRTCEYCVARVARHEAEMEAVRKMTAHLREVLEDD